MQRILFLLWIIIVPLGTVMSQNNGNGANLRGSPHSMVRQNEVADSENLSRIPNEAAVERMRKSGLLVPIPDGEFGIVVDHRLEENRRLCRPWTVQFLKDLGTRFQKKFGKSLRVNSCVRDIATQENLRGHNRNAAATYGSRASSHLTGATTDIARIDLSKEEQDFIRSRLLINKNAGYIEAVEEHRQAVWHVMVFKTYAQDKTSVAKKHK